MDAAIEQSPERAAANIKNPKYMMTLVEVYWKKGINGGEKFLQFLQKLESLENPKSGSIAPSSSSRHSSLRPQLNIGSSKDQSRNQLKLKNSGNSSRIIRTPRSDHATRNSSGSSMNYEAEAGNEEASRMRIANLSKQLYTLSSPPSSRRRSSVPVDPNMSLDDSMSSTRRHSSHIDNSVVGHVPMEVDIFSSANNLGELVDSITYVEPCIVRHAMDYQVCIIL